MLPQGNGRRDLPEWNHGREVEGRDARHHAERLAHGIDINARARALGVFALHHVRRADAHLDHFEPALNIAPGIGNGLAVFAGEKLGKLVIVTVHEFKEFHEHAHAALWIGLRPSGLCGLRILDRSAHFRCAGKSNLAAHRAIHGLHDVLAAPARSGDMLTADEVTEILHKTSP